MILFPRCHRECKDKGTVSAIKLHNMILMVDAIRYNARQKDAIKNVERVLGEFGEEFFPTENKKHYLYLIFRYV